MGQKSLRDWTLISLYSEPINPQRMPSLLPSSFACLGNNKSYVRMLLVYFSSVFMQSPPSSWWQTFNTDFQHWSPIGLHFQLPPVNSVYPPLWFLTWGNLQMTLLYLPNNDKKTKELNDKIKRRQKHYQYPTVKLTEIAFTLFIFILERWKSGRDVEILAVTKITLA